MLVLFLPGPWIDGSAGVGYRQEAGMGCGGQGRPAVRSRENLQIITGTFYQIHCEEITTVQLMEQAPGRRRCRPRATSELSLHCDNE